jgi:outer membrane protein OmpA-like peptidoglycan-associated protein
MICVFAAIVTLSACHHDHSHIADAKAVAPQAVAGTATPASLRDPEPVHSVAPRAEEARTIVDRFGPNTGDNVAGMIEGANGKLQDVFYEYDRADLTEQASSAVQQDARLLASMLRDFPGIVVTVEGHCDERGSAEYNLALGDNRAARTADALRKLGVSAKLETVSYGKENPQCTDQTESCWQKNRRAHLVVRAADDSARVN